MALECFRHCFLRLSFWTVESRELLDYENLIFLFFCSAMVLGMCAAPLLKRLLCTPGSPWGAVSSGAVGGTGLASSGTDPVVYESSMGPSDAGSGTDASDHTDPVASATLFRILVFLAIPLTVVGYFSKGPFALALDFITVIMVSGAMSLCLDKVVLFIRVGETGRFIGICFAVMATLGNILFFLPFYEVPTQVSLVVVCAVLLIALLAFPQTGKDREAVSDPVEDDWILEPFPQKEWIQKAIIVVGLYAIIAGMLDNLYFFDDAFSLIPNFLFYILLYSSIIDLLAGYLFDKGKWFAVILGAFLCICLGQSMSFFSSNALLIFPYTVLSTAGSITLEVFLVSLPLIYYKKRRQGWIFAGLGYVFMYGGFLITSIFFEAVPMLYTLPTLGVLLLISLLAVVFIFILRLEFVVFRTETVLDAFTSGKDRSVQMGYLTEQERKILNRLLEAGEVLTAAEKPHGSNAPETATGVEAAGIMPDAQTTETEVPDAAAPEAAEAAVVNADAGGDVSVPDDTATGVAGTDGSGGSGRSGRSDGHDGMNAVVVDHEDPKPGDSDKGEPGKLFSSMEQEIAPLLCQGYTQFEIARHLHIDVAIVKERIHDIRDKIVDQTTGANERMLSVMSEKYRLTTRERQMLYGIYNGKSNVEIAAELFVSEATIKFHIRNLLKKLSVENRYQVAELLRAQGH